MKKLIKTAVSVLFSLAVVSAFGQATGPVVRGTLEGSQLQGWIPFSSGSGGSAVIATQQYLGNSLAGYLPLTGGVLSGPVTSTGNTIKTDGASVLFAPLNGSNQNQWRILSAIAGLNPGNLLIQNSTNAFSSINGGLTIDPLGNMTSTGGLTVSGDINANANVNVKGTLSSTLNTQPASPVNTGVSIGGGPNYSIVNFTDSTRTANNRVAQQIFFNGAFQSRFASDDGATAIVPLAISGGQAGGITGITSNSGSGTWVHTGSLSATGNVQGFNVVANGGSLYAGGSPSTPLNVTTASSVQAFIGGAANQATLAYVNAANTSNNRAAYSQWAGSTYNIAGFANDAFNAGIPIIQASGGYASGIAGIQSNSGSGSWVHTGTFNATTAVQVNGVPLLPALTGTTGSIGGGALLLGACASGTVAVANATTGMSVIATPVTYPGDGSTWSGYVSAPGTVTVKVCAIVAMTPTASAYNVRVIQ